MESYLKHIEKRISSILRRPSKTVFTFDILDTVQSRKHKLIVLKQKQYQMKIGEIWQEVLGSYNGYINLKTNHSSGLDILSITHKIVIELKNRTNTDNSSSRKANFEKLVKFKKKHPDYKCIYACINDTNEHQTLKGSRKIVKINGVEIEIQIGYLFLYNILGTHTDEIVSFVKECIDKTLSNA